jgi:hypothetical protein
MYCRYGEKGDGSVARTERRSVRGELEVQYWEEGRWKCGKKRDGSEGRRDVHM